MESLRDTPRMMRRGLVAGAGAALWIALADYGAIWLWLPVLRDRSWLLVRLVASLVPIGALLGATAALLGALSLAIARTRRPAQVAWSFALPLTALAIAPSLWLARRLCEGGKMAKLAARLPIEAGLGIVIPTLLYLLLVAAAYVAPRLLAARERRVIQAAIAALALASGLAKLNQVVLPNLYGYLHALLALGAWGVAALGLALLLATERGRARVPALDRPRVALALALVLGAVATANVATLDANLNVRVALFDARSPASRALLEASEPLLRTLETRRDPRTVQALPRPGRDVTGLPSAPGAHVLLVTIDALRADHLGTYGYARPVSPELDALAQHAAVFERAYAQAPHSSYSLSSLHTSEYLHEVVELGRPLPTATLATTLAAHGYHTAAFFTDGIFHTEGAKLASLRDSAFGFALFDHTNRESEQQTERVLAEVDRIKQRGEPPSLLWVHYFDVHEPYQETTFGHDELDRYDSEILHVDRELSRLLTELEARFSRDVVLAISADHGEEFREHGGVYHGSTLYDEQVRVPLIVRMPGLAPARVATPVEVIDIAPTLLGAVGVPVPESMRGRDLRAVAAGRSPAQPVFSAVLTKRMALVWPHKLIADLRFGLFELYDLAHDPHERRNLAGAEPPQLTTLRDTVYAWLDGIDAPARGRDAAQTAGASDAASREESWRRALHLGRLGDRRAVAPTCALLLDPSAPTPLRIEAGQNLAKLADPSAVDALLAGLDTEPPTVAAEAAIALGRMVDERARAALRRLMHTEDPYVRARAAVSLGRLRDRAAVPALIDALWVAPTQYEREEAVRWLGRLRDPAAMEPLLSLLPEFGLRHLLPVALGQIGDSRAFPALTEMLEWESRTNIRDEIVRGLGLLGDARAIPLLVDLLDREPALKNTAESLVRLSAAQHGALGGLDVGPRTKGLTGLAGCRAGPLDHDWDYLERTTCTSQGPRVQLVLPLPAERRDWASGARLIVRARRSDAPEPIACSLDIDDQSLAPLTIDGSFRDQRIELPDAALREPRATLTIACPEGAARIALDHALIAPRTGPSAAREVVAPESVWTKAAHHP